MISDYWNPAPATPREEAQEHHNACVAACVKEVASYLLSDVAAAQLPHYRYGVVIGMMDECIKECGISGRVTDLKTLPLLDHERLQDAIAEEYNEAVTQQVEEMLIKSTMAY